MTDPMKRPLQRHRIPRRYAVAPLISSPLPPIPLWETWSDWDHYIVGKYTRSELTLAQLLPTGVDYRTLDDFPDLPDWALTAFQAVGHVRGVCTSILAYRTPEKRVILMAYAEIYVQRRISLEFDTRSDDPDHPYKESFVQHARWGAAALAYHGIFVNVYYRCPLPLYDCLIEEFRIYHGIDLYYRHDRSEEYNGQILTI